MYVLRRTIIGQYQQTSDRGNIGSSSGKIGSSSGDWPVNGWGHSAVVFVCVCVCVVVVVVVVVVGGGGGGGGT